MSVNNVRAKVMYIRNYYFYTCVEICYSEINKDIRVSTASVVVFSY